MNDPNQVYRHYNKVPSGMYSMCCSSHNSLWVEANTTNNRIVR